MKSNQASREGGTAYTVSFNAQHPAFTQTAVPVLYQHVGGYGRGLVDPGNVQRSRSIQTYVARQESKNMSSAVTDLCNHSEYESEYLQSSIGNKTKR